MSLYHVANAVILKPRRHRHLRCIFSHSFISIHHYCLILFTDLACIRSVPVSVVVSAALAGLWLHVLSQPEPEVTSEYRLGVWVTAAMVVMETTAQPLIILAQAMLFVKLKVRTGTGRRDSVWWCW